MNLKGEFARLTHKPFNTISTFKLKRDPASHIWLSINRKDFNVYFLINKTIEEAVISCKLKGSLHVPLISSLRIYSYFVGSVIAVRHLDWSCVHGNVIEQLWYSKYYHGVQNPFGIATNYKKWRIYWLPESNEVAASSEDLVPARQNCPVVWTQATHQSFPLHYRNKVVFLLLVNKTQWGFPREIFYQILVWLAIAEGSDYILDLTPSMKVTNSSAEIDEIKLRYAISGSYIS